MCACVCLQGWEGCVCVGRVAVCAQERLLCDVASVLYGSLCKCASSAKLDKH